MPSQKQLRWSQLRVGITVIVAVSALIVLIFLMSGTGGLFSSNYTLITHFADAEGLREGQPVDLQGVQVGNVQRIRVNPDRPSEPVEVVLRVNRNYQHLIRSGARAGIATQGVLGEAFINIEGTSGEPLTDNSVLLSKPAASISDVFKGGQTTLQNLDTLLRRMDRILAEVEHGNGTLHGILYDPAFIDKANGILNQAQEMLNGVNNGRGTIGKFFVDDAFYRKTNDAVDKLDRIIEDANSGKGSLGKLIKDETLYNNLNQTVVKVNRIVDDVYAGHGALGRLTKDEELAKKLDNVITKLSAISTRLEAGEGSAGKLLRDPALYNNSDRLLVESRGLIKAVRDDPKKYLTIHLKIF